MFKAMLCATLLCIICVTGSLVFFIIEPVKTFGYITRSFTVTNSLGSAQTNYPIEVTINTALEIAAGRMRSDCGDIRAFDTGFVTQFVYDVRYCNSTFTSIIYIDPNLTTGAQTHYVTYGDPALVSATNPAGVYDIYDLNTNTTTPSCTQAGSSVWDNTNKWLQLTSNTAGLLGTCNYTYLSSLTSRGYKAFFEGWTGGTAAGGQATWQYAFDSGVPTEEDIVLGGSHFTIDEAQDRYCYTTATVSNAACTTTFARTTIDNSTWRAFEVSFDTGRRRFVEDGAERINQTTGTAPTITNTNFGVAARTTTLALRNEHRVRNLSVIRSSESVAVGGVAANGRPIETLAFVIRNSTDTGLFSQLCNYGDVTVSAVATCQYRLKVTASARGGYTIQSSTSGSLGNGVTTIANVSTGVGGVGGNSIIAGAENYGLTITAGSCTNGSITLIDPFNPTPSNSVRFNHTTFQSMINCSGPNAPLTTDLINSVLVDHRLAISANTPAGYYTQSVSWLVVPTY